MKSNTPLSQTLKFHFGKKVFCTDGQVGILQSILFEAKGRRLTSLAVKPGRWLGKTSVLPLGTVERANADGIWLKCTQAEVETLPPVKGPDLGYGRHTSVKGSTGEGKLVMVATLPGGGELAYIVAQHLLPERKTLLQATSVADVVLDQILIEASCDELLALPPYRSDASLQKEVDAMVYDLPFFHIDRKGMHLQVLDSVLYMNGNSSSTLRSELIRDQVAGVKDLREIQNNLVGDDTLAAEIASALGKDQRTSGQPIGVYPQLGVVRLSGFMRNTEQKEAAIEIAHGFAGVREVINDLRIDPSTIMLYVMSSSESGEGKDMTPGTFTRHIN
jgi:hypothetical protein